MPLKRKAPVLEEDEDIDALLAGSDEEPERALPIHKTESKTIPTVPDGCILAYGWPTGFGQSTTEGNSIQFKVITSTNIDPLDFICIPNYGEPDGQLPCVSNCLQYTLILRIPQADEPVYYRVVDIVECEPRFLKRKEFVESLFKEYPRIESIINDAREKNKENGEKMRIPVQTLLNKLPKVLDNCNEINEALNFELPQGYKWVATKIRNAIRMSFRIPEYYKLLSFFTSIFLNNFNNSQLKLLWALVQTKPELFCFWESVGRVLTKPPLPDQSDDIAFPPDLKKGLLYMDSLYAILLGDQMAIDGESDADYFSVTYHMWNLKKYTRALNTVAVNSAERPNSGVVKTAIEIYAHIHKEYYLNGSTSIHIPFTTFGDNTEQALTLLCGLGSIMRYDRAECIYVGRISNEITEYNILNNYKNGIILDTKIYDCAFYGEKYAKFFTKEIRNIIKGGKYSKPSFMFLSANRNTSTFMSSATGTAYKPIDDFSKSNWPKKGNADVVVIGIDQFHKLGANLLCNIIVSIPMCFRKKVILVLGGTSFEKGATYYRGGGNIMYDLIQYFGVEDITKQLYESHPLYKTHVSLSQRHTTNIDSTDMKGNDWALLVDCIKEKTQKVKERGIQTYQIFCSTNKHKDLVKTELDGLFNNTISGSKDEIMARLTKKTAFRKYSFSVGQKVYNRVLDIIGTITRIWLCDAEGNPTENITNKGPVTLPGGAFGCVFDILHPGDTQPYRYHTKKYSIVPAYVMRASDYCSTPIEHGIFVLDENSTTVYDLLTAIKYCKEDFRIFVPGGFQFNNIFNRSVKKTTTDLGYKLCLLKEKKEDSMVE